MHATARGIVIVLVYVDDLLLTGSDATSISALKEVLQSSLKMKNLSHLTYFLGLEILRSKRRILVNQRKYTKDFLALATLT
ncbi:reverse transcriptase domain-containing protein, partial [Mycobacterium kansasii]